MSNATTKEATKLELVINPKTKKPGCVLLQAAYGNGANNWLVQKFDKWDVGEGMSDFVRLSGTVDQWKELAAQWNKVHAK